MSLQTGDRVRVIDGSWSYSFCDTGIKPEHGITLTGEYEVIQTGLRMPIRENFMSLKTDRYDDVPDNDTLIKEVGTGKIVSIQEEFLRKIKTEPPKPAPKIQKGDKVVPIKKSAGCSWEKWEEDSDFVHKYFKEHGFLYVLRIINNRIVLSDTMQGLGDFFLESDLIPYVEPPKSLKGFSVGDRVKVNRYYTTGNGKVGTVKSIESPTGTDLGVVFDENVGGHELDNNPTGKPLCEKGYGWWIHPEYVEHYVEPPKGKFKVGDIVTGNAEYKYGITNSKMTKGEVIEVNDDGFMRVKILEHKEGSFVGEDYGVEEKYFDLVVDEPKAEVKPFGIGDKVVPHNKTYGVRWEEWKAYRKGNIKPYYNIERIWPDGDLSFGQGIFHPCDVTLYVEPKAVKPEPKPAFAVGDRVRIRKDLRIGKKYGHLPFTESMAEYLGNVGTISQIGPQGGFNINGFYWAAEMLELLPPQNHCPENKTVVTESVTYKFKGATTTCVIVNEAGTFKGKAKCSPDDVWDEEKGKAWAKARAYKAMACAAEKALRD